MGTEIKTWQIINGELQSIQTTLKDGGRKESYDLEPWIASNPMIIGPDIAIIGRQVETRGGPIDLLGIDDKGNLVIIELKRDELARDVLSQAIDYASAVADWSIEETSEICRKYKGKSLGEFFSETYPDSDWENVDFNDTQRIILIGFSIESSLDRMITWLTNNYNVNINAIVLNYIKTSSGDELLTKTSIISEIQEQERVKKQKKFIIPMSNEPGTYDMENLKQLLLKYLSNQNITNQRIRDILLPLCLKKEVVTRDELKREFMNNDPKVDESKAGLQLSSVSTQLGMAKNDFLRQIMSYENPNYEWEKDNFAIKEEYKAFVKEVLGEVKKQNDTRST